MKPGLYIGATTVFWIYDVAYTIASGTAWLVGVQKVGRSDSRRKPIDCFTSSVASCGNRETIVSICILKAYTQFP